MSCLIYKEFHQSKYIEVVSNLQIQNIIQDYKDWHFKASVVEAENPKIKQVEQNHSNLQSNPTFKRNIFILEDGVDLYTIFDSSIKLNATTQKSEMAAIRTTPGMMNIIQDANLLTKAKRIMSGQGIEFQNSDFIVKIGEYKKNNKYMLIIYCFYKMFNHLPLDFLQKSYVSRYENYLHTLLILGNVDGVEIKKQVQIQLEYLNDWRQLFVGQILLCDNLLGILEPINGKFVL